MTIDRYPTPDGEFTLLVDRRYGDVAIGFDGFAWHTHADIVAECRGDEDEESALRRYLDDLFKDGLPIIVRRKDGAVADAWVSDFPGEPPDTQYLEPGESLEIRRWSRAAEERLTRI